MATRVVRMGSIGNAARDYCWLIDRSSGMSVRRIAGRDGVSVSLVNQGILRAKAESWVAEESSDMRDGAVLHAAAADHGFRFRLLFPAGPLTPRSKCPHPGPIPEGTRAYCVVCHQSGMDINQAIRPAPDDGGGPSPPVPPPSDDEFLSLSDAFDLVGRFRAASRPPRESR